MSFSTATAAAEIDNTIRLLCRDSAIQPSSLRPLTCWLPLAWCSTATTSSSVGFDWVVCAIHPSVSTRLSPPFTPNMACRLQPDARIVPHRPLPAPCAPVEQRRGQRAARLQRELHHAAGQAEDGRLQDAHARQVARGEPTNGAKPLAAAFCFAIKPHNIPNIHRGSSRRRICPSTADSTPAPAF